MLSCAVFRNSTALVGPQTLLMKVRSNSREEHSATAAVVTLLLLLSRVRPLIASHVHPSLVRRFHSQAALAHWFVLRHFSPNEKNELRQGFSRFSRKLGRLAPPWLSKLPLPSRRLAVARYCQQPLVIHACIGNLGFITHNPLTLALQNCLRDRIANRIDQTLAGGKSACSSTKSTKRRTSPHDVPLRALADCPTITANRFV